MARMRRVFEHRGAWVVSNEDTVAVVIETESGALGALLVSQVAPGRKNALVLEIYGTTETVRFEQGRPEQMWVGARRSPPFPG